MDINDDTPQEPRGSEAMVHLKGWKLDSGLARRL